MIPVRVKEIAFDLAMNPVLLLIDEAETSILPIWVGPLEAQSIAIALESGTPPRPLTHDLIKTLFEQLKATLTHVVITDVHEGTYYAQMHITREDTSTVIDARPSDAVAIALRSMAPIFITDKVARYTLSAAEVYNNAANERTCPFAENQAKDTSKKTVH
ncbi:MAG: bifunctional nuclease family protein [Peptococcaceae bacterium]|nr:bifunctional nuclease family protein [Peptococcaceae bacterium]